MKQKARERLPKRAAGSFPSYLYKSLDELEGAWGHPGPDSTGLIGACHALRRKPLLLLTDEEIGLALRQRVGLPWMLTLTIQRLRQEPMRLGHVFPEGDLLRYALQLSPGEWGALACELREIASTIIPTLPETPDHLPLVAEYRRFTAAA